MKILGIGTDIVECLRIAQLIERHAEQFLARVFTAYEIEYCNSRKAVTQHFAARWAAKEAVLRAIGEGWAGGFSWTDIEIRSDAAGNAKVALGGEVRRGCERRGIGQLLVTLAHCRTHASAYAIASTGVDDELDLEDLD